MEKRFNLPIRKLRLALPSLSAETRERTAVRLLTDCRFAVRYSVGGGVTVACYSLTAVWSSLLVQNFRISGTRKRA